MRVLLISHTCQSRTEGQPRAEHLSRLDQIHIKVLSPDRWRHYGKWRQADPPASGSGYEYEAGRVLWPWSGPAQFYLHWYPRLKQTIRAFQPDIIDLWEEPWSLVAAHTCLVRNRHFPGLKILFETEQNVEKQLPALFERFRTYTQESADYAVGRNQAAIEILRKKGYCGEAEVVPNAVDTATFRPRECHPNREGLGDREFLLGYIGRLVEEKGLLDLLDAMRLCPPTVRLLFVGEGPLQPELERRIAAYGLTPRVEFRAAMPHARLAHVLSSLDALALVSRTTPRWKEQFGRVIIEAHACAIPVIGSCSGAIPDVIGKGGLVVPEADPTAIAQAIKRLHAAPQLAAQLGCAGFEQVQAHYTWQQVAARMHSIYSRMLDSSSPAHNLYA